MIPTTDYPLKIVHFKWAFFDIFTWLSHNYIIPNLKSLFYTLRASSFRWKSIFHFYQCFPVLRRLPGDGVNNSGSSSFREKISFQFSPSLNYTHKKFSVPNNNLANTLLMNSLRRFGYEGNRNCEAYRRPRQGGYSEGNPKNAAYPWGWPVTDNIEKLAKILLRHVGLVQQNGLEIVHIDEEIFVSGVYPQGV